jgi:ABC-type phosphate transport system substrate-binding protein
MDIVKTLRKFAILVLALGGMTSSAHAESPNDLLIVVNKSVSASNVDAAEVKAIFLKNKTSLSGDTVFPLNAKSDSDLRAAFRKHVLKMSEEKEKGFWEDEKVKKGVEPPPETAGTLKAVFSKSGGISYVFRKDYKDGTAKIVASFSD